MNKRTAFFTERLGVGPRHEARDLHDIPPEVRQGLVNILSNLSSLNFRDSMLFDFWSNLYNHLFEVPSVVRAFTYERFAVGWGPSLIESAVTNICAKSEWNAFFDVVEACDKAIRKSDRTYSFLAFHPDFQANCNELFLEHGMQWRLVRGKVERRRPEPVAATIENGLAVLAKAGFEEPNKQLGKALRALDERPVPDVENCVKDAVGALEGTGKILVNDPNASLEKILATELFRSGIHQTLRDALRKVEAYRGDASGAGHAMVAGKPKIEVSDAEFVLTTCVAGILLLIEKAKEVSP